MYEPKMAGAAGKDIIGVQPVAEELSDADVLLLTESRTAKWALEQYEFAYDARIRIIHGYRTLFEFLAVFVAITFLFTQYVVKEHEPAHTIVGIIGTGVSLTVVLMVIWSYISRWPDQIERKRDLSREIREMIGLHKKVTEARPLDHLKVKRWIADCIAFEEKRKHELATVPLKYLQAGYRHIGNSYPDHGPKCKKCSRPWQAAMNQQIGSKWQFWKNSCDGCGVQL